MNTRKTQTILMMEILIKLIKNANIEMNKNINKEHIKLSQSKWKAIS